MNAKEYAVQLKAMQVAHTAARHALAKAYAVGQTNARLGDMLRDEHKTIKATDVKVTEAFSNLPYLIWSGLVLTKAGHPRRDGGVGYMQDSLIKEINGEKVKP